MKFKRKLNYKIFFSGKFIDAFRFIVIEKQYQTHTKSSSPSLLLTI